LSGRLKWWKERLKMLSGRKSSHGLYAITGVLKGLGVRVMVYNNFNNISAIS
jgi:uncharacterized membrane protein